VLRTDELDYDLPERLIATHPARPRDSARLFVVSRSDPDRLEHRRVRDLPGLLAPADVLVFNTTRVVPARLAGVRRDTGGRVEGMFLRQSAEDEWVVLLRGRRLKPGVGIDLLAPGGVGGGVGLVLREKDESEPGGWFVEVCETHTLDRGEAEDGVSTAPGISTAPTISEVNEPLASQDSRLKTQDSPSALDRVGLTPLPPYILRARRHAHEVGDEQQDRTSYQTVYAESPGSVAAPTAGLHFTPELLADLEARGVGRADVVLHVGTGTFKPISSETVEGHEMHAEWCSMDERTLARLSRARASGGGRVIPVGTTSARTIESYAALVERGEPCPDRMETRLLISPGYRWRVAEGLLTNFHLPRSTLLAMVAALFSEDGRDGIGRLLEYYRVAITEGYRFYSYGDAMLVLP
jgi:S-adenosylmethionine:tRNA ribosyltransferase-isomerase